MRMKKYKIVSFIDGKIEERLVEETNIFNALYTYIEVLNSREVYEYEVLKVILC